MDKKSTNVKNKVENNEYIGKKMRNRTKKRKRSSSNSSEEVLPENILETEKNIMASALKNNLDEVSVKKILKKVVTNDHVLALVKLKEEEEEAAAAAAAKDDSVNSALTRSKIKVLMKKSPKVQWVTPLTPIKQLPVKTRPEVTALIAEELPEDEDDEEYEPTNDDIPSDDDQMSCSDLDSQPRTPATPSTFDTSSPMVVKDGPFKIPQDITPQARRKLQLEEDQATIALRTRSKLSLSSTPIEHIESSFVPPDDLPMPDCDPVWNQFIEECLNPLQATRNEDDEEADPEYNAAADTDANEDDELENSIIKISQKEIDNLLKELMNMPANGDDTVNESQDVSMLNGSQNTMIRWEGKQEPLSDEETAVAKSTPSVDKILFERRNSISIGKNEPPDSDEDVVIQNEHQSNSNMETNNNYDKSTSVNICVRETNIAIAPAAPPVLQKLKNSSSVQHINVETVQFEPEQILILQQQLRQHIQLSTSSFLQIFVHPTHWAFAPKYKEFLESIQEISKKSPNSVVDVCNLQPALELVRSWENSFSEDNKQGLEMVTFHQKEIELSRRANKNRSNRMGAFHPTFLSTVANSRVFLYPHLLPPSPFRNDHARKTFYTFSEDQLIILGVHQFWEYVEANPEIYKPRHKMAKRWGLSIAVELTSKHMLPWLEPSCLSAHINAARRLRANKDGPIYKYFKTYELPQVKHHLLPFNPTFTLYEQPDFEMPKIWLKHLSKSSKRFKSSLLKRIHGCPLPSNGVTVTMGNYAEPSLKKPPEKSDLPEGNLTESRGYISAPPEPTTENETNKQTSKLNYFTILQTSAGTYLVPVQKASSTVNKIMNVPVDDINTIIINNSIDLNSSEYLNHCDCCRLIRRIDKKRQRSIKEYFKTTIEYKKTCPCKDMRYPKITNRLRLFLRTFKSSMKTCWMEMDRIRKGYKDYTDGYYDADDIDVVTSYKIKLTTRLILASDARLKKRIYIILSGFDANEGDPVWLAKEMYRELNEKHTDLYKEFLGFLTAEQAFKSGKFLDYFIYNRLLGLIREIEKHITNTTELCKIISRVQDLMLCKDLTACQCCVKLMQFVYEYPQIVRYVFNLFPHVKEKTNATTELPIDKNPISRKECREKNKDTDSSSESEDDEEVCEEDNLKDKNDPAKAASPKANAIIETEATLNKKSETTSNIPTPNEDSSNSEDLPGDMTIVSDNESVKSEPEEWKREEDKVILEVLKQCITPQHRKGKTILEIIEEKQMVDVLAESLPHKSMSDIEERMVYLLQVLLASEKSVNK